ncbi:MAG: YkgJ family cysteine cluster protein [Candidatus Aminicenantes bacterium]|nr:YkgJ family cysteine cluster protein [Candidatus Aminicenantes bacterium]NIM81641.1 YkgJ family cysteine cluster protein [Candidatus Aminicenantes bacterium]NIN21011.1 YkgJ family cysteine cluster protein [Candidatus Aminicenantes bacterium]NIN44832.1 YkgJ family cysteine cluster protein [Candidatus Aminicenantes bacterium]NIN87640.1 YkgJ family cysteine cluster protein [Candidatus Aminicenantes bacterium]
MDLIVDIDQIKKLSKKKEEENWGFRSFLKSCGIPPQNIDLITHRLYKKIAAKIDCMRCGNCCKEMKPVLTEKDISTCANGLNLSETEFKKQYLAETEEPDKYTFNKKPCPFLQGTLCSIYNIRPLECRSFPHIQKKGLVSRLISVVHNCSLCPIVFNVYEGLKSQIWSMGDDVDIDELDEDDLL